MAVVQIARFEVRPDAREAAERAMHELAAYVRRELPDASWTASRDAHAPTRYLAAVIAQSPAAAERARNAAGMRAFIGTLEPLPIGELELTDCELVTSSDLQRRSRPDRAGRRR
jgi:quinol monooxygenase YgiN